MVFQIDCDVVVSVVPVVLVIKTYGMSQLVDHSAHVNTV